MLDAAQSNVYAEKVRICYKQSSNSPSSRDNATPQPNWPTKIPSQTSLLNINVYTENILEKKQQTETENWQTCKKLQICNRKQVQAFIICICS